MKLDELNPGDMVSYGTEAWCHVVTHYPHPLFAGLALVVWHRPATNEIRFDALLPTQEIIGDLHRLDDKRRRAALRDAMRIGK